MKNPSKWLIFILVAIAQFMVVLDSAITNVALPTIKQQLHFTTADLQWVITAYALTFGGFLLLGGRVADLFGRKRTLLAGMIGFTAISFLIGINHSSTLLIALRAIQGLAAAFMSPAALSIVLVTFRDGADRNKALGYWSLVAAGGAAFGLLLGGLLTQYFGWRWNFFINVPIGIVMTALIARIIPEHEREETKSSLDLPGALLVTSSLILQVYAFSQATTWGWLSSKTIGVLGTAIALLIGFAINESHVSKPLMPLSIVRIRNVLGANIIMASVYATLLGSFFLLTLYIQSVMHYSPVLTGVSFLPFPLTIAIMSTRMPKLVARYGFKRFLVMGPILVAIGMFTFSLLHTGSSYWLGILPGAIITPLGMGMTFMPLIAAATSGVPGHQSGIASGLITTSQQMGGALGLSILSGIASSATVSSIHLGFAEASIHGYHVAFLASVGFLAFAALIAAVVVRSPKRAREAIDARLRNPQLQSSSIH
jgi:EmrB/QacA subfamily drug resistance transporter